MIPKKIQLSYERSNVSNSTQVLGFQPNFLYYWQEESQSKKSLLYKGKQAV